MGWCDDPSSKNIINLLNIHLNTKQKNFIDQIIFMILSCTKLQYESNKEIKEAQFLFM